MAGLDPAIHPAFEDAFLKIDGYAGQARVWRSVDVVASRVALPHLSPL